MSQSKKVVSDLEKAILETANGDLATFKDLTDKIASLMEQIEGLDGVFFQYSLACKHFDEEDKSEGYKYDIAAASGSVGHKAIMFSDALPGMMNVTCVASTLQDLVESGHDVTVDITVDDNSIVGLSANGSIYALKSLIQLCLENDVLPYASPNELRAEIEAEGKLVVEAKLKEAMKNCKANKVA